MLCKKKAPLTNLTFHAMTLNARALSLEPKVATSMTCNVTTPSNRHAQNEAGPPVGQAQAGPQLLVNCDLCVPTTAWSLLRAAHEGDPRSGRLALLVCLLCAVALLWILDSHW